MKLKAILISTTLAASTCYLWLAGSPLDPAPSENHKTVAITQIVDHPSLNRSRQGVEDALKNAGYIAGKNLTLLYETPHGNMSVGAQIANKFNHQKPDAIVSISTTSSQMMLAANTNHLPIIFASVTDPLAAQLVKDLNYPGGDITGTMETPPIRDLLTLIGRLLPNTKTIGIIYSASEVNSVKSVESLKAATDLKVVEVCVSNSVEVTGALNALVNKVDVLILPSDNTVWSAMDAVVQLSQKQGIPVFTNDPDSAYKGVTLALGYSQYDIGIDAGNKLIRVLQGENPGNISVTTPAKTALYLNMDTINKLKLTIPQDLINAADVVIHKGDEHA